MLANYAPKDEAEEQKELINCSSMHPTSDSMFLFGMSKGTLKMGDLRTSSCIEGNGVSFGEPGNHKNYLYELLASHNSA